MSKKREFPILNGKLISDLDANGHKIIGADIEVPAEKIKEAVAPELEAKADKTELEAETQRATGVEATLGNSITAEAQRAQEAEVALRGTVDGKVDKVANATAGNLAALDSNGNLVDSGKAIGNFALAESLAPFFELRAYEVGDLCTSFDNDEQHKGTWLYKCILATDGSQPTWPETDPTHWALATVEDVLTALRTALAGKQDALSQEQVEAVNSGITADKVSKLEGVENKVEWTESEASAISNIFRADTDLLDCDSVQDVAIRKLSQLLGEDVAGY